MVSVRYSSLYIIIIVVITAAIYANTTSAGCKNKDGSLVHILKILYLYSIG